jgi:acyl carrier protein
MQITETITAYLRDEALDGRTDVQLSPTTQLVDEEVLDSLAIFSMVSFLEDHFDITIEPEDVTIENFSTIPAIEALVQSKAEGAPQS